MRKDVRVRQGEGDMECNPAAVDLEQLERQTLGTSNEAVAERATGGVPDAEPGPIFEEPTPTPAVTEDGPEMSSVPNEGPRSPDPATSSIARDRPRRDRSMPKRFSAYVM